MNYHGFSSVHDYMAECVRLGWSCGVEVYHQTAHSDYTLPAELQCVTLTPKGGDIHTDIALDPPSEVRVLISAPMSSPSATYSWAIFNSDFSTLYADGVGDAYHQVLECWGYR